MIFPNCICENASGSVSNASEGPIKGLTLDPEKVTRAGKIYNTKISIQTKPIQDKPEGTEGSERSTELIESQKSIEL